MGLLICQGKKILDKIERKIWWPDLNMSEGAAAINHFNYEEYKNQAQPADKMLDLFEAYLYDERYMNVGQNTLGFDCCIHNIWRRELGRKADFSYTERLYDTKACFAAIMKGAKNPPKDDFLAWQYTFLNLRERGLKTSLSHQMKHYNLAYDPNKHHDACVDVEYTFEVFKKQLFELDI